MHIVVVARAMDLFVVFSLFIWTLLLALPSGALAPPYHLNFPIVIIFIKVVVFTIVFVVDTLVLVSIVVSLVLVSVVLLVMLVGVLAPPYHLNL